MTHDRRSDEKLRPSEVATTTLFAGITAATAAHEIDAYTTLDTSAINQLPLMDHATSMEGGFVVGALTYIGIDKLASAADDRDKPHIAKTLRRLGGIATMATSIASQTFIETNPAFGYGDKWDIAWGVVATIPGIIHGHNANRRFNELKERKKLAQSL